MPEEKCVLCGDNSKEITEHCFVCGAPMCAGHIYECRQCNNPMCNSCWKELGKDLCPACKLSS